jgi:hypothetical protein
MTKWLMLLAAGLVASPVNAADAASAPPSISASGQGNWEMICHIVANGDQQVRVLGPDHSIYSDAKMQRASCDYKNTTSAPLVITIAGAPACPFKDASADACSLTVAKGRAGSFDLKVKVAR